MSELPPLPLSEAEEVTKEMERHSFERTWVYVVPPHNTTRVIITQRVDGPFRKSADTPGRQHFYISVQRLGARRNWEHVETHGFSNSSLDEAQKKAALLWSDLRKKVQKTS